jgi:hypothetical protein
LSIALEIVMPVGYVSMKYKRKTKTEEGGGVVVSKPYSWQKLLHGRASHVLEDMCGH